MTQTTKATHEAYKTELFAPVMKETTGNYIAVLSDTSVDRDEERVGKSALEKMKLTGYVAGLIDHENRVLNQVCEWTNKRLTEIDGHTALVAEPKFFESNPNAKIIKGMLDEGAQIGISIGAIVKSYEDNKIDGQIMRTFTDLELLEASFVAIPSNRHGRAIAVAKSFNKSKVETKMSDDKKFTQKDIDLAVSDMEKKLKSDISDLNKQLESKDSKISELEKQLTEKNDAAEKSIKDLQEKVTAAEKALDAEKKTSLEKQTFIEKLQKNEGGSSEDEEEAEKAIKSGKLPIAKF